MLRTVLSASVIAIMSIALLNSYEPPLAEAARLIVTSSADSGPGSFRAAIAQANNSSSNNTIILANRAPITLQSPVVYTGERSLTILGSGLSSVIQGAGFSPGNAGAETECSLFESTNGADLTFTRVTFQNTPCNGIEVYGGDGDAEIAVTLNSVVIRNMGGAGLHLYEIDGGDGSGSDAGWKLRMVSSRVEGTGYYDLSLTATNSKFNDNGTAVAEVSVTDHTDGDGVDLQEVGDGDLTATLTKVQANNNHQDGIDLHEAEDGDLRVTATAVSANYNANQDGIQLSENEAGALVARLAMIQASSNDDDGVQVVERGDGGLDLRVTGSVTNANNDGDGYRIQEWDGGDLVAAISGSTANDNGDNGFRFLEDWDGSLKATLTADSANNNADEGFDFGEWGDGAHTVRVIASFAQGNQGFSLEATAEFEAGTIQLTGSVLIGDINLENVDEL